MTREKERQLKMLAIQVREDILTCTCHAKSGHPGGSLSAAEMLIYLYNEELRIDPRFPNAAERDRFVLSKGHVTPALYAVLAQRGYFPAKDLKFFRQNDSHLQGHPNMNLTPGVDMSTGSLGQGVSAAAGMAKGAKILGRDINVYAMLGDGELDEGQVWEAALFAAHYKLDNFCIIVDMNGFQIDGATSEVMNTEPVDKKLEAFGFHVVIIDGHSFEEISRAFEVFHKNNASDKPTAILMRTIKGKGISFMENQVEWHGKAPNEEELARGLAELREARKGLEGT